VVQLNVADGSTGSRGNMMLSWLKEQAISGVMIIGLCELNTWEQYEHLHDINKNHPIINNNAANAGFSFSHIMVNNQPYHIGIMSVYPFEIKGESLLYLSIYYLSSPLPLIRILSITWA